MAGFPWSELGLDGPADERTIRRAYASRLKIVRPDVDAAGFQRLVQARDIALRAIERTALRPLARPTRPADPVPKPEEAAAEVGMPPPDDPDIAEAKSQAPRLVIDVGASKRTNDTDNRKITPPAGAPGPVEIELSGERPSSSATPQPPPSQRRPLDTTDVDPPKPPPTATEPDTKPAPTGPLIGSQSPDAAGSGSLLTLLSAFVEAWSTDRPLPPVAPILALLGEQSIAARQRFEIEALRAIAALLDKGAFDRKVRKARQLAARSLILGLDDEYAWSSNDRRLYMMMPQAMADQIARLLRSLHEWVRTGRTPFVPPRRKGKLDGRLVIFGLFLCAAIIRGMDESNRESPKPTPPQVRTGPATQPLPNYAAASFRRGVAYDNKGEFDRAIQAYDEAIWLDPSYTFAFYNRGLDYANKGQFDRAIEDYSQAIRLRPRSPDYFISRGVAYDSLGQYDRAIQDYDQAIRLKPNHGLAFVDRGIAYANQEQYDRAIQDYDEAVRINPNDPDALYNRGQAKRAKGDIPGGDADLAMAKQSSPTPLPAATKAPADEQPPSPNPDSKPAEQDK
jgi:tetratricopeptide (TPR) repeat protein